MNLSLLNEMKIHVMYIHQNNVLVRSDNNVWVLTFVFCYHFASTILFFICVLNSYSGMAYIPLSEWCTEGRKWGDIPPLGSLPAVVIVSVHLLNVIAC